MSQGIELYYKPWTFFWIIQTLSILLFLAGLAYKYSFYRQGQRKSLYRRPDYRLMLKAFCRYVMIQKQLARQSIFRWFIHISIFYGFLGLLLLSVIAVALETVIPQGSGLSRYLLYGQGHNYYKLAGDIFGLLILLGLLLALYRRFVQRDRQLYTDQSDSVTLVFLLFMVITGFMLEGVRIALSPFSPELQYSFVGYRLAALFGHGVAIKNFTTWLWVFHSTLNAAFFAYIPHSKFMHIINSPIEIALNASEERMRGDLYL